MTVTTMTNLNNKGKSGKEEDHLVELNWLEDFVDSMSENSSSSSDILLSVEESREKLPDDPQFIFKVAQPAKVYVDRLISSLNDYDLSSLHAVLRSSCSPDVVLLTQVYRVRGGQPLQERKLANIDDFCKFLNAWHLFIPDGVFTAPSPRVIVDKPPTLLFMSSFTFQGRKLLNEVELLTTPFEYYDTQYHEEVLLSSLSRISALNHYRIHGSLAIYVDTYGQISQLELFLSDD